MTTGEVPRHKVYGYGSKLGLELGVRLGVRLAVYD